MEIKTKYNLGDDVFTWGKDGKIAKRTIKRISVFVWPDETRVSYDFTDGGEEYEDLCFPSKEAFLEYITSDVN